MDVSGPRLASAQIRTGGKPSHRAGPRYRNTCSVGLSSADISSVGLSSAGLSSVPHHRIGHQLALAFCALPSARSFR